MGRKCLCVGVLLVHAAIDSGYSDPMWDWMSVTAFVTTVALQGTADGGETPITEIELHMRMHGDFEACTVPTDLPPRPRHIDPLTHAGLRSRCVELARVGARECIHVQVGVVRDFDGSFLVDVEVEPDFAAAPDAVQQLRASGTGGLAERGAILARWPRGAWHDVRICLDAAQVVRRRIDVPAHCTLLESEYWGKPHSATLERAGDRGCVVATNTESHPMLINAYIAPPAEDEASRYFRLGEQASLPACVEPGEVRRWNYELDGPWAQAWHVLHYWVMVGDDTGDCRN